MRIIYAKRVEKDLRKLDPAVQDRIIAKLDFYASQQDPLKFAETLLNHPFGDVRFRVGDYRVICELKQDALLVTAAGHRRDIYR